MTESTFKIVKNENLSIPNRFKFIIKMVGEEVVFACD